MISRDKTSIYVDAKKVSEEASGYLLSDILQDSSVCYIGRANWNVGEYFKGLIDEFSIYNYALTASQVSEAYQAYREKKEDNIIIEPAEEGGDKQEPISITSATIKLSKTTLIYTGKAQKPKVTVANDGKKLTADKDYTVIYSSNKKVGQGTVTVVGKGNYKGQTTVKFTIMPQTNKVSKLTNKAGKKLLVKLSKTIKKTGAKGYEISYSTKKSFKGAKKVKTTKTSYTLKNLKKGKTYYVRVRSYAKIGSKIKYGAYSKAVKKKVIK